MNAFAHAGVTPGGGETLYADVTGGTVVTYDEFDVRGTECNASLGMRREDLLSLDDFRQRYSLRLPLDKLKMSYLPPAATLTTGRPEPSASEGLLKLWGLLVRGANVLARYLPSWLPQWESEDGKNMLGPPVVRRDIPGVEVVAQAWHPDQSFVALAVCRTRKGQRREEFVSVYDLGLGDYWRRRTTEDPQGPGGEAIILRSEAQVDITALAWQPMSRNTLAVACHGGVCLWQVTRGTTDCTGTPVLSPQHPHEEAQGRPAVAWEGQQDDRLPKSEWKEGFMEVPAWLEILSHPVHGYSSSLCWSPDGALLAVGCAANPTLVLWDIGTHTPTLMKATPAGLTHLSWSESGNFLMAATTACSFIVWEAQTWQYREWSGLPAPCNAACWGRCGEGSEGILEVLLFSTLRGTTVHALHMETIPPQIDGTHFRIQDTTAYVVKVQDTDREKDMSVMGPITALAWSPVANRLIVAFENGDIDSARSVAPRMGHAVALYAADVLRKPVRLESRGYLVGPRQAGGVAGGTSAVAFACKGEQLVASTCWLNGEVSFWPLY